MICVVAGVSLLRPVHTGCVQRPLPLQLIREQAIDDETGWTKIIIVCSF